MLTALSFHGPTDLTDSRTMANRIIRESALTSTTLFRLSDGGERLFWRLVVLADDYGRFEADTQIVKSKCFPLWSDGKLKVGQVERWLGELVDVDAIQLYVVNGRRYGYFPGWERHQRVRNKRPRFPDPAEGVPRPTTTFYQRAISVEVSRAVMARDGACLACGDDRDLVLDHIVPVVAGGLANIDNLQVLCQGCNHAKHTKVLNFLAVGDAEREFSQHRRNLRQSAANGGESRPVSNPNPIQSEFESNNPSPAPREQWGTPDALVALYNRLVPEGHPRVTRFSPERRRKAALYLRNFPEQSFWVRVFSEIRHSAFLQRGSQTSPNFRGDFDWLLTKGKDGTENAVKVAEGKYRDAEDRG
jgi:hypothetical protein